MTISVLLCDPIFSSSSQTGRTVELTCDLKWGPFFRPTSNTVRIPSFTLPSTSSPVPSGPRPLGPSFYSLGVEGWMDQRKSSRLWHRGNSTRDGVNSILHTSPSSTITLLLRFLCFTFVVLSFPWLVRRPGSRRRSVRDGRVLNNGTVSNVGRTKLKNRKDREQRTEEVVEGYEWC